MKLCYANLGNYVLEEGIFLQNLCLSEAWGILIWGFGEATHL
ncbi:MAG: hypothetical protein ACK4GN_10060 [Runella sp.]